MEQTSLIHPINRTALDLAVLVVLVVLALAGCAAPVEVEQEACFADRYRPESLKEAMAEDPTITYRELNAEERRRFLAIWNATPPQGGYLFDTIGVYDKPSVDSVFVVFMERGCIWNAQQLHRDVFLHIVRGGEPV